MNFQFIDHKKVSSALDVLQFTVSSLMRLKFQLVELGGYGSKAASILGYSGYEVQKILCVSLSPNFVGTSKKIEWIFLAAAKNPESLSANTPGIISSWRWCTLRHLPTQKHVPFLWPFGLVCKSSLRLFTAREWSFSFVVTSSVWSSLSWVSQRFERTEGCLFLHWNIFELTQIVIRGARNLSKVPFSRDHSMSIKYSLCSKRFFGLNRILTDWN